MDNTLINRRYRVDRLLGEGGMAEVFLGYDTVLQRQVAIKRLRPQFARDANFRLRFEREARAVARFSHPNIIDIYDVGEEFGRPYIVMEYVNGESLNDIIHNEGPFHPDDVATLVEQVAAGLDYAHQRGVVHRDVKPQNILVDRDGIAKLLDFGIAKNIHETDMTIAGEGLGTVQYLSPEQASGLMATPSSDIYSLGVVAYEMLTDRVPFDADTAVAIAMMHVDMHPMHPTEIDGRIPEAAGEIILRSLAKDPTQRFATAGDFADALANWRSGLPSNEPWHGDTTMIPTLAAAQRGDQGLTVPIQTQPQTATQPPPSGPAQMDHQPTSAIPAATRFRPPAPTGTRRLRASAFVVLVLAGLMIGWILSSTELLSSGGRGPDPTSPAQETMPVAAIATENPASLADTPTPAVQTVPRLIGLPMAEAEQAAGDAGFVVVQTGVAPSDSVPDGVVIKQDPPANATADEGAGINVVVSSGAPAVDVGGLDLAGQPADDAQAALETLGVQVERDNVPDTEVDEGRVIRVEPESDIFPGDTVTLLVSLGDVEMIPTDIWGKPVEDGIATLEELGFDVAEQSPATRSDIEGYGIDLEQSSIEPGDIVGILSADEAIPTESVTFGAYLPRGTKVALVYFQDDGN